MAVSWAIVVWFNDALKQLEYFSVMNNMGVKNYKFKKKQKKKKTDIKRKINRV